MSGKTATQAAALQYQPWSGMACALKETHLKQNLGSHPQISTVSALWAPQNSDISEFPPGPECQRLGCSASSVQPGCRLSDRAQGKLQVSNLKNKLKKKLVRTLFLHNIQYL